MKQVYLLYFTKYALNFEIWGINMHLHLYMCSETWNINWQPLHGIKSKYLTVNLKHAGVENDDVTTGYFISFDIPIPGTFIVQFYLVTF